MGLGIRHRRGLLHCDAAPCRSMACRAANPSWHDGSLSI
ncbi:hypothetical protein PATSB16_02650 [Pandoraea thiooxydans]|nr:hypothetical protein PATSB16_02650 [Pandoraea thiooxydans]